MKILIWTKNTSLKNMGGPMGYCYNIKSYLEEHPCEEIDFYPKPVCSEGTVSSEKQAFSLKGRISEVLSKNKYASFIRELYRQYFKKVPLSSSDKDLLKKYDFVHLHWAREVFQTFSDFNNGKTKVVLTTHTPEPLFDELVGRFGVQTLSKRIPIIRNYFLKKEVNAYKNVDIVMFPALEAKEPYINKSPCHKNVFERIENKTIYVPTAINKLKETPINRHRLDAFAIPDNALKVCYVGRHNEVKGYDFLKHIALRTWEKNPNVYFIIGGKEEPLKGLKDSRWIELGWVNTCELLNEVDVFVLPNKETYFDIILLEVLRQGVPVLITRTGGNKWFERRNIAGIHCFDYGKPDDGVESLLNMYEDKLDGTLADQGAINKNFFCDAMYMSHYIENYTMMLKTKLNQ